jgi:NAD(P)-dependent dehydrogenase (short-subunit alcohol dehydrogenase family)/mannose-6-phosphate isomerase-like protein (cupin superfamily)
MTGATGYEQVAAPKMLVNNIINSDDPRYAKALELYKAAGYDESDAQTFEEIHCTKDRTPWISNGFLQTFTNVDGKKCRVCVYFPTQTLIPHLHDLDEDFLITHGAVNVWTYPDEVKPGKEVLQKLGKGQKIVVPDGLVHCLRADVREGLVFHETVGEHTFKKRATEFQVDVLQNPPPMPSRFSGKTVLVTGANRGLGLGFATALTVAGARVVACCRDPSKAEQLNALEPKPVMVPLDIASEESVNALPGLLKAAGIETIELLINNAGISSPNHPQDPILESDMAVMRNVFDVNVIGTIMVSKACLPFLAAGKERMVMNLSSQLASLDKCWGIQGRYGGVSSYRVSRAASNMALRCFGGELRDEGYIFISMSPGHVATDMGSAGGRIAPLTVEQSIDGMLNVLSHSTSDDNGKFLQYDGAELPW